MLDLRALRFAFPSLPISQYHYCKHTCFLPFRLYMVYWVDAFHDLMTNTDQWSLGMTASKTLYRPMPELLLSDRGVTTIFTTTRLFFSKHLWALCNTLPSIIPYMESVWCYRNWIELEGIKIAPNYPVNLRWRVIYWLVRGFRVVDVARILHVW